jgi:hypothetical protein
MKPIATVVYLTLILLAAGFVTWWQAGWLGPPWLWFVAAGVVACVPLALTFVAMALERRKERP